MTLLNELRLILVCLLADVIRLIAPSTPEGNIWTIGIAELAEDTIALAKEDYARHL